MVSRSEDSRKTKGLFDFLNKAREPIISGDTTLYQIDSRDSGNQDKSLDLKGDWMWDPTWDTALPKLFPNEPRSVSVLDWVRNGFRLDNNSKSMYFAPHSMTKDEELNNTGQVEVPKDMSLTSFFKDKGVVLDLNTGTSKMMRGIIDENPGLERAYVISQGQFNMLERNNKIKLLYGDWSSQLKNIPLNSVDAILSVNAIGKTLDNIDLADAMTCVAREGCLIRYRQYRGVIGRKSLDELLNERGWAVWMLPNLDKFTLTLCKFVGETKNTQVLM